MQSNPDHQTNNTTDGWLEKLGKEATSSEHALQIAKDAGFDASLWVEDEDKSWFLLVSSPKVSKPAQSSPEKWETMKEPFSLQVYHLKRSDYSRTLEVQDYRDRRSYNFSPLPILRDDAPKLRSSDQKLLMDIYKEICSTWRLLTDVRFKLLGFVPAISGALILGVFSRPDSEGGLSTPVRLGIALLGLMVTIAISNYDKRNSELYNELISRGRRIEAELGIDTGHFRGRPKPRDENISHGTAVDLIYGSTGLAWLLGIIAIIVGV